MEELSQVKKLAKGAILATQRDGTFPKWVGRNVTTSARQLRKGLWELEVYLFKKRKLGPGESWEKRPDGSKMLVVADRVSGEKSYVISYQADEGDRVNLFRVEVEMPSEQVAMKEAVETSDLDPNLYELYYEE